MNAPGAGVHRDAFAALLNGWLAPERFKDAAENGLQVEGAAAITRVVCGVSANRSLIERAVALSANAIVVHHGLVWGGGIRRVDGWLGARIRLLLAHDINLFAYHLPLDAHPELGNNAGLARALGVRDLMPFGDYKGQLIGLRGAVEPMSFAALQQRVHAQVGAPLAVFGDADKQVRTIGLCTGGAPEILHDAITQRLDAYVTGEVTEWVKAVSDESGTAFIAAGHHATERFGVRALAERLCAQGIDASFVDVDNPA